MAFEQWEQKFATFREDVARETAHAVGTIHEETETRARTAQAAAAEALKNDLPRWLAPQLEQLTHQLTAQLAREGATQRDQHEKQLSSAQEALQTLCAQADEAAAKLRTQAEMAESQVSARLEAMVNNAHGSGAPTRRIGRFLSRDSDCRSDGDAATGGRGSERSTERLARTPDARSADGAIALARATGTRSERGPEQKAAEKLKHTDKNCGRKSKKRAPSRAARSRNRWKPRQSGWKKRWRRRERRPRTTGTAPGSHRNGAASGGGRIPVATG